MQVCKSCSAPLPTNTNCCQYCGVRNDVDLPNKQDYSIEGLASGRICPVCHTSLQTIDLKINGHLYIERCQTCFGLFFDPGEVEAVLENSVSEVFEVNWQLLENINQERYPLNNKVRYVKCPVCQVLMNRVNFGYRSGVVVDQCSAHGIWLENGEISHLIEWKKAGGQLWAQQRAQQEKQDEKPTQHKGSRDVNLRNSYPHFEEDAEPDLLKVLSTVIFKLFE